jgi:predicted component of type VI protein secretion system
MVRLLVLIVRLFLGICVNPTTAICVNPTTRTSRVSITCRICKLTHTHTHTHLSQYDEVEENNKGSIEKYLHEVPRTRILFPGELHLIYIHIYIYVKK